MSATNQHGGFLIYGGFLLAIVGLLFFLYKKVKATQNIQQTRLVLVALIGSIIITTLFWIPIFFIIVN
jgi:heme/copper-type cytochrome/quinol oxidase subunit 4